LTWTQHVELLRIKTPGKRRKLERLIITKKLSKKQIRQAVHEANQTNVESPPVMVVPSLTCTRKPLLGYDLVDQTKVQYPKGMVVVDCGFNVWRTLPGRESVDLGEASYTYPARIESVIDGDTLWAVIDCGFDTSIREKLRLRGIDAPELGTPEGDRTRRYVRRTLKACPTIVIQTHKTDKYDRYLSDIFYLPDCTDPVRIGRDGHFLNQTLLDKGLAQAWKP
jgi:endonuclease YncB( thermonuclease family)